MPEETLDGSHLEGNTEPGQVEAQPGAQPQPEQPAQEIAQPPQTNIPEQFRTYTPEQWFQEWNKINSTLGRYKQEVGTLRQRAQQPYPAYPQPGPIPGNPQFPSSLPGQEALGQKGQQADLNEQYFEKPVDVIKQVVANEVRQGILTYEQQQQLRAQQESYNRMAWIKSVDDDELQNLRLDENVNFTPQHEALMKALAETDPEIITKLRNPSLAENEIRNTIRTLHKKADGILSGDPQRLNAFVAAQKQAAVNGAPSPRASTSATPQTEIPSDIAQRWGFLPSLSKQN